MQFTKVIRNAVVHESSHMLSRPRALASPHPAEVLVTEAVDRFDEGYAEGTRESAAKSEANFERARNAIEASVVDARSRAFEEGRAEGLRQGRDEAAKELLESRVSLRAEAEALIRDRLEQLNSVARGIAAQAQGLMESVEDDIVALAHEATCRVIGKTGAHPDVMRALVRELIEVHALEGQPKFHVHPDDAKALEPYAANGDVWTADASVELGGVVIRTPSGSLDARLETQMLELRRTLLSVRGARRDASEGPQ